MKAAEIIAKIDATHDSTSGGNGANIVGSVDVRQNFLWRGSRIVLLNVGEHEQIRVAARTVGDSATVTPSGATLRHSPFN